MARECSICAHKGRKEIDSALVKDGAIIRTVAHQFGVSNDALKRHVKNGHIIEKIQKAANAHEAAEADDLLAEVQETEKITRFIISNSIKKVIKKEDGTEVKNPDYDPRIALQALARREKQIELKGRVLGSFKDGNGKGRPAPSPAGSAVVIYVPDNGRKSAE